jgi:hypothetical protein
MEIVDVPIPRPRDRRLLVDDPAFRHAQRALAELLERDDSAAA